MFTGIVEEIGTIESIVRAGGGLRMKVAAKMILDGTKQGDSIALDGVCLTVEELSDGYFDCFVSTETLEVSTLARIRSGSKVNLERALTVGGRIGGHFMPGHVEAVGSLHSVQRTGEGYVFTFSFPEDFRQYVVPKGSVAVDGVSLTIADIHGDSFSVSVIPETYDNTTLRLKRVGDSVNLEPDLILKYVRTSLEVLLTQEGEEGITMEKLINSGFIPSQGG